MLVAEDVLVDPWLDECEVAEGPELPEEAMVAADVAEIVGKLNQCAA